MPSGLGSGKKSAKERYGFGRVLGEGAFAHVLHGRDRECGHDVAVKVMLKSHIEREGKARAVMAEQAALRKCSGCCQIIQLERTFQDEEYLFFVTEYAAGGDLLSVIRELKQEHCGIGLEASSYYSAEIWLGLRHIHDLGLAHRDIKPENILLDSQGHVKIADFGAVLDTRSEIKACKNEEEDETPSPNSRKGISQTSQLLSERQASFDGTAEYVSPEVLQGEGTSTACDLWALGCVVYQLSTGRLPFTAATDFLLWEKILAFADGKDDSALDTTDLDEYTEAFVRALLKKHAVDRLGAIDHLALESHPFFHRIDWQALKSRDCPHSCGIGDDEKQEEVNSDTPGYILDPPYKPRERPRLADDKFSEFSIEFMLELEARDDMRNDDDSLGTEICLTSPSTQSQHHSSSATTQDVSIEDLQVSAPRTRRGSRNRRSSTGSSAAGSTSSTRGRRASGAKLFGGGDTQRALSPPRFQPSSIPTSSTQLALDAFDWASTLNADERFLWHGVVWKRKGLMWRERVFVLTSAPRLTYFDAHISPPEYKGQIAWTYERPVFSRRRSTNHFDVVTDDRDYHLASYDVGADVWIKRIDATLNMQATRRILHSKSFGGSADEARTAFHRSKNSNSNASGTSEVSLSELLSSDSDLANMSSQLPSGSNDITGDGQQQSLSESQHPPRRSSASSMQQPSFAHTHPSRLVLDEAPTVEGWLWKLGKPGAFGASTYRKRYAILRGIQLFYYRDKPSDTYGAPQRAPTGVLRCRAARVLDPANEVGHQHRFCFVIDVVGGRALSCFVESDQDRQRWLDALTEVLEARQRDHAYTTPRSGGATPSSPAPFSSLASFVWSTS